MARGAQWGLLGLDVDPVPGDPAKLDYLISRMHNLADDADRARRGVVGLLADRALDGWLGASGDAFRSACEPLPDHLQKLRQSYEDAASALKKYQKALTDARTMSGAAVADGVTAYGTYSCLGDAPPCHRMDDAEYQRWVDKLGRDLILQHQKSADPNGASQHTTFVGPYAWAPEQRSLLAARASALQAQTDNTNAANACHQALEDAAHLAAALTRITGAGASTPGVTFDERFKNAGGDISKLVLDPAAGQDVETAGMPPTGTSAQDVAAWWNGLDPAARDRYVHDHPAEIAGLDGIPQEARDEAYRVLHPTPHTPHHGDDGNGRRRHAKSGDGDHTAHHSGDRAGDGQGGRHRGGGDQPAQPPKEDRPQPDQPDQPDQPVHDGDPKAGDHDPRHEPGAPGHDDTSPKRPDDPGRRHGGPPVPPNQTPPNDPAQPSDPSGHNPFSPTDPAPDPGVRISMPAPVVEPHPHAADYHVTSEPHHSSPHHTAPPADLWRTGSHSAYQEVAAPDAAVWLPGANAPHADLGMDTDQWAAGAHVPRIDASTSADFWFSSGHSLRDGVGMDSGVAAGAFSPGGAPGVFEQVAHAAAGSYHPGADVFQPLQAGAAAGVFERVGHLAADAYQPAADVYQPSGAFSGEAPNHPAQTVASSGVLLEDERSTDRRYYS
ncbi:hypothetical protein [Catenulispora subtropica]|uniref:PPE family domain-containing protein n=1 Tax=Catenulispora subtropica TaxID=450798 RepID=A0ABN2RGG5_9ACTN